MTDQVEQEPRGGCIATGIRMFAGLAGLITLASVVNVMFDLELELEVSGTSTALPTDWMAVIALGVVSGIAFGISWLMTSQWVGQKFKERPWLRWITPILIVALLSIGFYATYYNIEYAGPLHYASRANDIETIREELQEDYDEYDLHRAVWEAIELDHVEILILLLAEPSAKAEMKDDIGYALDIGSKEVIIAFIDAGVETTGEDGEFLAEFLATSDLSDSDKEEVGIRFLEAGADPYGYYTGGYQRTDLSAVEQAEEQGLTRLVKMMEMP